MKRGYLTVYLSLSLTVILSLLLTLVEGARNRTIRMETECVADIGMNSVLAEFHRELLEQYDLLFVDMSYGTPSPSIANTEEHLKYYMNQNFSAGTGKLFASRDFLSLTVDGVVIPEYSIASDDNGNVMRHQALAYMKESSVEGTLSGIIDNALKVKELGLDTGETVQKRQQIQAEIDGTPLPEKENEEGEMTEISLDNPADKVNALRGKGILQLVLEDAGSVSQSAILTQDYLSHRTVYKGTGLYPGFYPPEGMTDKLLFDEYLMEKCGRYGNEQEKSHLKYQIEYILAGKEADWKNLEKAVERLLLWREAANVIYLFSDAEKCAQAQALALTLTAVMQVPVLATPVKYSILFAWAFIESLYDVKTLLKGGRVPLLKTGADWKTSIENIMHFNGSIESGSGSDRGLSYDDYLRVMLFMQEDETKNLRAMDIMEMDIRKTPGNSYFRMDACFDSFLADVGVSSGFGYSYHVNKRYVYK